MNVGKGLGGTGIRRDVRRIWSDLSIRGKLESGNPHDM